MYLKSIEMQGFKSFANKIRFEFDEGVTGIVGPNGSGKSNIADAVRWVLGEQSAKQLRGASMQDVIFAGTENRKPVSFAYVALTLDNSDRKLPLDYEEVVVSRRVFRSGESEYLLNGTTCRLRDIHELFYDTGIGKEGYSIIGQGQIDKILSGKPEDRRELFDEAAGIVKFKKRKAIAQKKLENERLNLVRVTDILTELEKRVGPLERQSEKARQFLKLKEELRGYDISVFLQESERMKADLVTVETNRQTAGDDLEGAENRSHHLRNYYEQAMEEGQRLDGEIERDRDERTEAGVLCENLEGQIKVLEEQIHTQEASEEHVKSRMAAIAEERAAKEEEKLGFREQKAETNKLLDAADDRLTKEQEKLEACEAQIAEMNRSIQRSQQEIIDGLNEKANLGAKKQRYDTMMEQAAVRRSEINERLIRMKTDEETQKNIVEELEQQVKTLTADVKTKRQEETQTAGDWTNAGRAVDGKRRALLEAQQKESRQRARLESLQNLAERYEGFGVSTRKLMEERAKYPGVIGTVADLVRTEARYELAVETALGGTIQNIVTDTEQTAKRCVEFLKANRHGRATFLPLDSIQYKDFRQTEALRERGVIGLGSELLQVKPEYKGLAKYLLGSVVVVDTMDNALVLARKYRHDLRIVTLEGELLNRGGSITGGAFKNNSNLLGRKRELEELEKSCKAAQEAVAHAKEMVSTAEKRMEALAEQLATTRDMQKQLELSLTEASANLRAAKDKSSEVLKNHDSLMREIRMIGEQVLEIKGHQDDLSGQVKALEERRTVLEKGIVKSHKELAKLQEKQEKYNKRVAELTLDYSNMEQKDQFLLENLIRLNKELEKLDQEKNSLKASVSASKQSAQEKREQIEEVKVRIVREKSRIEALDQDIENKVRLRNAANANQKKYVDEREALQTTISQLNMEVLRLDHQKEDLEKQMEGQIQYLWTEYEITPSDAKNHWHVEDMTLPAMKKQMAVIKGQIKDLGTVNVGAMEEYKEVSERYYEMKTQYDDLMKAEESLQKIIEDLDEGMRRQFAEKFADIQREFDKVFKELFGGGKGTLQLVDGEDVLEAGIQIIAQPPGKKLVNMMQMSGGEKALTAISILFAIQNLKPSPFCLLDEIEAALDDANVARFAEYLKKLQKNSQFITITHRRGTMLAADRLYGITMQEKGVSTQVSVSMIDE